MPSSNTALLGGLLPIFPLDIQDSCFFAPLFTGVRGKGCLRSLHTVSCIENGASKPQGSLLSESTPDDQLIHVVVLSRYARSSMLHCYDGQGAEHTRFLPSFALTAVSAVVSPTPCPYCRRRHGPPQASSESSGRGRLDSNLSREVLDILQMSASTEHDREAE